MIVGFTGTREGATKRQLLVVESQLDFFKDAGFHTFAYGGATGADEQVAEIAGRLGYHIHQHPSFGVSRIPVAKTFQSFRAKGPLARNRDIVNSARVMLAIPAGFEEELRSGTWATIRYAARKRVKTKVIWPNGEILEWTKGDKITQAKSLF